MKGHANPAIRLRRHLPGAALLVAATALCHTAHATRISVGVAVTPEPFWHSSYVRDGAGKAIAFTDFQYDDILHKYMGGDPMTPKKYDSVDVVFQTCFGGGFLDEIAALPVPHTFASSAAWWESSYTDEQLLIPPPGGAPWVDNFTRAYREAVDPLWAAPVLTMRRYFREAAIGINAAANKDPFAPASAFGVSEHPQYNSPDMVPAGPNDTRTLGGINQFAILVAWDIPEGRHGVNMSRMRDALQAQGVPPGQIVDLWGPVLGAGMMPPPVGPWPIMLPSDPLGLGAFIPDAPTTNWAFDSALNGIYYGGGAVPGPGSKLLVFNTGHGGHAISIQIFGIYIPIPAPPSGGAGGSGKGYQVPTGTQTPTPTQPEWNDSVSNSDGNTLMQVTFDAMPAPGVTLEVNGIDFGSLDQYLAISEDVVELEPYVSGSQVHFQVAVHHTILGCEDAGVTPLCDPENADIRFIGMDPFSESPRLLSVLFRAGDQEAMAVMTDHELIPTPCFGDADGDRDVDFDDLNIVMLNWATNGPTGDIDYTAFVDFDDLNIVLDNWGNICP